MRIGLGWWFLLLLLLWASYARAQTCSPAALTAEFTTDPTGRTYSSCASDGVVTGPNNNDQCTLDLFNAPCTATACKVDNVLSREAIMETLIDSAELEKLARSTVPNDVARKAQLDWLMQVATVNMAKAPNQQKWKNVFTPADSPLTNTAINNAQLKNASRATVVCHRPGTLSDVSCGLRGEGCL